MGEQQEEVKIDQLEEQLEDEIEPQQHYEIKNRDGLVQETQMVQSADDE